MAKSQEWKTNSTTIENGRLKVSGAEKYVSDGSNKLSTFTRNNFSGRVKLVGDSADRIANTTYYSIDSDGYIDFYRKGSDNKFKKYQTIQEIADAGILGYNSRTSKIIKNSLQENLSTAATEAKIPGAADPKSTVNNDGDTDNDGIDTDEKGDDNDDPFDFTIEGPRNTPGGKYRYPLELGTAAAANLDSVRFTQGAYKGSSLPSSSSSSFGFGKREFAVYTDSSVTIGIQPQISDSNSVKWNGSDLNAIRAEAARVSMDAITSNNTEELGNAIEGAGNRIKNTLTDNPDAAKAINTYLAGKAVGVGGALLSRVNGAILNPNLELLFEGPDLRQFNYTFKMSAESPSEANSIKSIIKWFKKGMAVRKDDQGLFMNTPNIFKIQYIKGQNESTDHDGLNRIKECALLNVQTNYTPEGNYSTFEDGSMTMYDLSLTFGELTPIIASDYYDAGMIGY